MKYILSIAVGGIILLHSVVPHEHHVKTGNIPELQSHECSTSIFDGVRLTFDLHHGDGHLEQFVNMNFDGPELLLIEVLDILFVEDSNLSIESTSKENYTFLSLSSEPLRGPPC